MHVVRWLGFAWRGGEVLNLLHLFPNAREVTAPYPVQVRVSVLRSKETRISIPLEGVQTGRGVTVYINDLFHQVEEREGVYGVIVEMTTNQPHFDLTPSISFIEGVYGPYKARYRLAFQPEILAGTEKHFFRQRVVAPIMASPYLQTSLIVINGSELPFSLTADEALNSSGVGASTGIWDLDGFPQLAIASNSVREIPLTEREQRSGSVSLPAKTEEGIVCYMMYRDRASRRPISVFSM